MNCFIISYDLCSPDRNYNQLYSAIKSYGTWGRLTESTWAIVTNSTAVQIRDFLMKFIDNNDRLVVIKGGKEAAWIHTLASNSWVKQNLAL